MREINSTTVQKHNLNICINVSALQLIDENFASHVSSLLTLHNYPASRLHIEITESVFAEDKETLKNTLATLQEIGIKISIDDFGTGYSSLSAIQKLNIDTIKIDKSFINNTTPRGMGLIKGILVIAKSFGYSTIAEGVETPEQADQLKKLGIDYLQGYYYSKPIPTTSPIKILEEQNLSPSKL